MSDSPALIHAHEAIPALSYPALNCTLYAATFNCFKSHHLAEFNLYLKMLASLNPPLSGGIDYPKPLSIAYVDENIQLISALSGLCNLKLAAEYHQLETVECINERAEQLLVQFDCTHINQKLPAFMTHLEKRLLLIARSLMLNPDILFIENPFQGLGMKESNILGDHLISLVNDAKIAVVSSFTTLAFIKKAAQNIIFADDKAFYSYNTWDSFKKEHSELLDV